MKPQTPTVAWVLHQQDLDLMHFSVGFPVKVKRVMSPWAYSMALIARFRVTDMTQFWKG